ncbi:hypothetical protein DH2020_008860 [Rehmannia glutinosa]|uniref:Aspartate/glutamate/uridylate kinase domain-containing protein n=1 Tax=Rehmannia glutinosa TaxID=99300 RepID=A0ABR0X4L8_REHGL
MLAAKILPFTSPHSKLLVKSNDFAPSFQNTVPVVKFKRNSKITCLKSSLQSIISPEIDNDSPPAQTRVKILSEALPFIQKFRGKTIVVKYGGAAMKSEALQASVIADIVLLACVGLRIVFVHGGGPEINQWLGRLNIQPNFLNGLRVTDASTMEIVSMVLVGKVNKHLVALINKAGRKLRRRAGGGIGAEKLILLTDVAGILENREDPGSLVKQIDIKGVKKMIKDGKVAGGMIPKVNCCIRSLAQGVRTTSIIDGRLKHSLLLEILTDEGAGTMITG